MNYMRYINRAFLKNPEKPDKTVLFFTELKYRIFVIDNFVLLCKLLEKLIKKRLKILKNEYF